MQDLRCICFHAAEPPGRPNAVNRPPFRPSPFTSASAKYASKCDDDTHADPAVVWLLNRAGLDASAYRATSLQRRLTALLRQLRVGSPEAAKASIERNSALLPRALDTVLIGVTDFFRDSAVFEQVRLLVLPELLRSRPGIDVFAAGVSDGKELYSVAMLLEECGALRHSRLLGVDCRSAAIEEAQRGFFSGCGIESLKPQTLSRHFYPENGGWRARSELRERIAWRQANLLCLEQELARFDLILFRNVSIYLKTATAARIWDTLCGQLAAGGFLVTGKAETPPESLPLTRVTGAIYRKT